MEGCCVCSRLCVHARSGRVGSGSQSPAEQEGESGGAGWGRLVAGVACQARGCLSHSCGATSSTEPLPLGARSPTSRDAEAQRDPECRAGITHPWCQEATPPWWPRPPCHPLGSSSAPGQSLPGPRAGAGPGEAPGPGPGLMSPPQAAQGPQTRRWGPRLTRPTALGGCPAPAGSHQLRPQPGPCGIRGSRKSSRRPAAADSLASPQQRGRFLKRTQLGLSSSCQVVPRPPPTQRQAPATIFRQVVTNS